MKRTPPATHLPIWIVTRLIFCFSFLFIIILVYNYNTLVNTDFSRRGNDKVKDDDSRITLLERRLKYQESKDISKKLQERLDQLERLINERVPSKSESLINVLLGLMFRRLRGTGTREPLEPRVHKDNRMDILNNRLSKLERQLDILKNNKQSFSGVAVKLEAINYRLEKLARNSKDTARVDFSINSSCKVPQDWLFPFCEEKVKWLRENWDSHYRCYVQQHAVDPDDTCSILIYLSEVESWCPLLEYRKRMREPITDRPRKEAYLKRNDYDLMAMMKPDHWRWMRQRIRRLWPGWIKGLESLMDRNHPVQHHWPKKIFLYMGSFANNPAWFRQAFAGAPLGELVQWSDLIAALFILGHNIVLCTRREEVKNHLNIPKSKTCASRSRIDEYDMIFTDYVGITFFKQELGPNFSTYRCRLRILDSFGTEAEFNFKDSSKPSLTKKRSTWGGENLHLRQFMTMFPHTPDNTFLGFVVEVAMDKVNPVKSEPGKKPIGLVYGKDAKFWMFKEKYLEVLSKYLDLHGTVAGARVRTFVPSYVKNHRIMNGREYQEFLSKTKIYIGLGFPYDGPAPLEAIAHGSVFLNAKLDPPHSRENTAFFREKPTSRKLSSQHPYAEKFIGKPYVYTIDINNTEEVEKAVQEILKTQVRPYIPYEWTPAGMLERVNALVNNQNFCEQGKKWPPIEELHVHVGDKGKSCTETCEKRGLLCESSFFNDINNLEAFKRHGVQCLSSSTKDSLHAPSSSSVDRSCLLQKTSLIYSCSGSSPIYARLCPCRDFRPQQVALCKKCT